MEYEKHIRPYTEGEELAENEFLIKVNSKGLGFLSKPKKSDNLPPLNFTKWHKELETNVIKEDYRFGWEIVGFRPGMSQQWAKVRHPYGFVLEIHLINFLSHIISKPFQSYDLKDNDNTVNITDSILQGEFKWGDNLLSPKPN